MASDAPSRSLPLWKVFTFSLVVVALFFGAAEGALVAIDYPPKTKLASQHNSSFWITEPNLNNSPFLHKETGRSFSVTTNSRSMRYAEIPVGRRDDVLRIVALGDSTTFGWGVDQAETYPAVLEGLLQGKVPGKRIEVINGGVPGYSSFQGLHHVRTRVVDFQPDMYLIGYIVQDARAAPISDKDQAISGRVPEFLRANPLYRWRTYLWIRDRYQLYRSAHREGEAQDAKTFRVPPDEYGENLRALAKLAEGAGGTPVLFGFPLEVVGYTQAHRTVMAEVAKERGYLHFDPSEALAEASRRETLYFPQDRGHPNAAGCKVIAAEVAGWLESSGALTRLAEDR